MKYIVVCMLLMTISAVKTQAAESLEQTVDRYLIEDTVGSSNTDDVFCSAEEIISLQRLTFNYLSVYIKPTEMADTDQDFIGRWVRSQNPEHIYIYEHSNGHIHDLEYPKDGSFVIRINYHPVLGGAPTLYEYEFTDYEGDGLVDRAWPDVWNRDAQENFHQENFCRAIRAAAYTLVKDN